MTTRTFLDLENIISASAAGCPPPTVEQYVRRAAIKVCENTLAWRYEMDPVVTTSGVYEYDYDTPDYAEVCGLLHAAIDGARLAITTQDRIHQVYPAWPDTTSASLSEPRYIFQYNPDCFLLAPVPDDNSSANYSLKLFLALRPTPAATYMDKSILDEIEDAVVHMALKDILNLPDKSWTDTKEAARHAQEAAFHVSKRRAKANLGVGVGTISARMQPFA
jgi:hypothetical protein